MTADSLSQMVSDFLAAAHAAIVVEDCAVAFDLAESKYSISGEHNKCLLHLWSSERNVVRRVLDAEVKGTTLRLQVQRMGQNRPTRLDFYRDRDRRSPAARQTARFAYAARAQRALGRHFPGWALNRFTTKMDSSLVRAGVLARTSSAGATSARSRRRQCPGNADYD